MIDREKVIKGLKCCIESDDKACPMVCPFYKECLTDDLPYMPVIRAALKLLKEQEPKQIVRKQGKRENSDGSIEFFAEWHCPHCGMLLNRGFATPWLEFCYNCGRRLIWDD